jgi:tetratricopeptide (TPR) repeat protein
MILVLETNIFQDLLKKNKSLCVRIFLLIITIFSLISFIYSHEFSGKYPFWLNAVRTSPHSPLAHRNLGAMYFLDEKYDLSKKEFLKTLELNPQEPMVYNNLGLIYNLENKPQEAQAAYLKEIEINPTYDNVYYNQGLLYARYNHYEEAAQSWQKAFELNPRNIGALKLLADYYFYKKDFEKADALYKELQLRGVAVTRSVSSN